MLLHASLIPPAEALDELWSATHLLRALPGVNAVPRAELDIPVTSFGNLLPADCDRLAAVLRTSFEGADAPVVQFDGLRREDNGSSIDLGLAGDVEPLADLARFVPEIAKTMRLYVDRRRFRARMTLATVEPTVSPSLLGAALESLSGWSGSPWSVPGLSLLRIRWQNGESRREMYDLIELD